MSAIPIEVRGASLVDAVSGTTAQAESATDLAKMDRLVILVIYTLSILLAGLA